MAITVLVVDDSSTVRKIIGRCLHKAELGVAEVCEAGNGQEALDLLAKRSVDVVLSDINMPQMDGNQLLSAIKGSPQWNRIPVLIISTEAGAEAVLDAVGKGAAGYIKKPFTPAEIHDQLGPLLKTHI
ncbi:MAG TPA: response regulator [Candidatus Angelobacter sp.]|nr:response regulator [Candidatus Angelobacter sp.]